MGSGEWDTGTSEASHVPALTIVAVFSLMVYVGEWALSMALASFGWVFGRLGGRGGKSIGSNSSARSTEGESDETPLGKDDVFTERLRSATNRTMNCPLCARFAGWPRNGTPSMEDYVLGMVSFKRYGQASSNR